MKKSILITMMVAAILMFIGSVANAMNKGANDLITGGEEKIAQQTEIVLMSASEASLNNTWTAVGNITEFSRNFSNHDARMTIKGDMMNTSWTVKQKVTKWRDGSCNLKNDAMKYNSSNLTTTNWPIICYADAGILSSNFPVPMD